LAGLPYQSQLPPLSIGFVSIIGVVMIAPISSYVAPLGARLAHRLPRRVLEVTFGLFLVLASARFVLSLVYPGTCRLRHGTADRGIVGFRLSVGLGGRAR